METTVTMTDAQRTPAHARAYDALDRPVPPVGDVVWETTDPDVVAIDSTDPHNVDVTLRPGSVGEADVTARVWSGGPAGRLEATIHVTVVAAPAVRAEIVTDPPVDGA